MIDLSHETVVWFSKSFGLIWMMILFIGITAYAYWPSNRKTFERLGKSILEDEDTPCR